MAKSHKKICVILSYIEHLLVLALVVTGCVSVSVFTSKSNTILMSTALIGSNISHDAFVLVRDL